MLSCGRADADPSPLSRACTGHLTAEAFSRSQNATFSLQFLPNKLHFSHARILSTIF
jgi:hypothetical protein